MGCQGNEAHFNFRFLLFTFPLFGQSLLTPAATKFGAGRAHEPALARSNSFRSSGNMGPLKAKSRQVRAFALLPVACKIRP